MSDMGAKLALDLSHRFDAPLPVVYRAWTMPEFLRQWWGPVGCTVYKCEVDLRPGGQWRYGIHTDNGQREAFGEYLAIEPEMSLAFTWQWEHDPEQTIVTVKFTEESSDSTLVTLHQEAFSDQQTCDNHGIGWTSSFESLTDHLREN